MDFADGGLQTMSDGPVGWLILNQPERLNAVRAAVWRDLPAAVASLECDPAIRIVIVRGAGDRAFASGADIGEFDAVRHDAASNLAFTSLVSEATASILDSCLPFLAMIHGYCVGGGVVIATACDMRVCSEDARFGVPAAKLGLAYELDNFKRLQDIVGPAMALEMLATGRLLTAPEALSARLVNRVVEKAELQSTCLELASHIVDKAPLTIAAAKRSSRAAYNSELSTKAQAAIDRCFDSRDFAEGRAAFREKRTPNFQGR